jgi:hypothetical protein
MQTLREERQPWQLVPGIDTLSPEEEHEAKQIQSSSVALFEFYNQHRIYFSPASCASMEAFIELGAYIGSAYQDVAIKDHEGHHYVNPEVIQTWYKAVQRLPELRLLLEKDFRAILDVPT